MAERTVAVASKVGLHARPAMLFTQAVAASGAAVTDRRPGAARVDASSILFVMASGSRTARRSSWRRRRSGARRARRDARTDLER